MMGALPFAAVTFSTVVTPLTAGLMLIIGLPAIFGEMAEASRHGS